MEVNAGELKQGHCKGAQDVWYYDIISLKLSILLFRVSKSLHSSWIWNIRR